MIRCQFDRKIRILQPGPEKHYSYEKNRAVELDQEGIIQKSGNSRFKHRNCLNKLSLQNDVAKFYYTITDNVINQGKLMSLKI